MSYQDIWQKIAQHQIITIFRHIIPDGDALGSQFGLAELIKYNFPDKIVYCLGTNQNKKNELIFPTQFDTIDSKIIESSLAIVLDTANISRVDDTRFLRAKSIIKIDHHIFVEKYGEIDFVDIYAASCTEILVNLILANNLKISDIGASYLFTGIITDTGRMLYPSVTSNTYKCLSHLLTYQFEKDKIFSSLYSQTENEARLKGYIGNNFKVTLNGVAYLKLDNKILKKLESDENAAAFVNTLSSIQNIDIWLLFAQSKQGWYRLELRSKNTPIVDIAKKYQGGGHKLAAGAKVEEGQIENIVNECDTLLFLNRQAKCVQVGLKAAKLAMVEVLKHYKNQKFKVELKNDKSPVTSADLASDKVIKEVINQEFLNHKILSEESADTLERLKSNNVWIIDPIDGTKDFIQTTGEFAINIAYVDHDVLCLGVVCIPDKDEIYFAYKGHGAYLIKDGICKPIKVSKRFENDLIAARSVHHTNQVEDQFFAENKERFAAIKSVGSSYKLCLLASGQIDFVYKSGSGTKEWDTAAPALIIQEAGGIFLTGLLKNFKYNRKDIRNLDGYIALNNKKNLNLFKK